MAETFARDGLRVIATMREVGGRNAPAATELRNLAQRERLALDVVEIDVADQASVERGVAEVLRMAGRVDVLVNNAAIVIPGPLELVPEAYFHRSFNTNVQG
jgi:NAD(P)-dependent dehydrogenase (short-subunit alcohol dehydrogenase family)